MAIKTRLRISADGYVTTPEGWPSLSADPAFVLGSNVPADGAVDIVYSAAR